MSIEANREIVLIRNEADGHLELSGLNGETEVDQGILDAVIERPEILEYVTQQIAHNRSEQLLQTERCSHLGDILLGELVSVRREIVQKFDGANGAL